MKIIFCGIDARLCEAWQLALTASPLPAEFEQGVVLRDITTLQVDAVVSPANSFGFMDGGVDLAYSHAFGWHVQDALQDEIKARNPAELLVGQALAVKTCDINIPWVIAAPTMRKPCQLASSLPIFLATRAAMLVALHMGLKSIAFPGMGTGTGGVCYNAAANAMLRGVREAAQVPVFPKSLRCLRDV